MGTRLYRFDWDCGRQGRLEGVFVADEQVVADAIGKEAYFGEVLGKHSEIEGTIEEGDIVAIECTDDFVATFSELFPRGFGFNPLDAVNGDY